MGISKVRKLFSKAKGDEHKLLKTISKQLFSIDRDKNGTVVGKKKQINYKKIMRTTRFPKRMQSEQQILAMLKKIYQGVGVWADPRTQVNVVPPPTNVSIAAATLAARYNENSIWDHYGVSAAQSEVMSIAMLADIIGYDKKRAGGIFTFGGTGCNLYAARVGIEKADPNAKVTGIRDRIKMFCSDISHYSILSAAIWTGLGGRNVVKIPTDDNNVMRVDVLEREMKKAIKQGCRIGTVYATMGTTDAFGLDPVKEIVKIRNRIQQKLRYKIHVHADAVIGWPYLTFKRSHLLRGFSKRLRSEVQSICKNITGVQYADSVGIDFHKTGWSPYLCSAIVVKNQKDFLLLTKGKKDMPYLYHGAGYQPGCFTLESSRPNYAQKALVNMMAFGKEGYETLLVHLLGCADYLRDKMEKSADIAVMNKHNPAFVTDFRVYPKTKHGKNGEELFDLELHDKLPQSFTERVNKFNVKLAEKMIHEAEQKGSSMISYTDVYRKTRKGRTIVSLKSYPMSPFTEKKHMNMLLKDVWNVKKKVR